jgi:hypothetical protein
LRLGRIGAKEGTRQKKLFSRAYAWAGIEIRRPLRTDPQPSATLSPDDPEGIEYRFSHGVSSIAGKKRRKKRSREPYWSRLLA